MRIFFWQRRQTSRRNSVKSQPSLRVRPRLEALEDRLTPSTLTVTRSDVDDGTLPHTLRWAVANAHDGDTILLTEAVHKSGITLMRGELVLTQQDLTIRSAAAPKPVTISGNHYSRIFEVSPGASVTLQSLTLADGNDVEGGGILVDGTASLTVTGCRLTGNSGSYGGGAIENDGMLTLTRSTLVGNDSELPAGGGGLLNTGTATVSGCLVSGNDGSGVSNFGILDMSGCIISGNTSSYAGGIYNGGTLTIHCSILFGNTATVANGGGIYNDGALTLSNSLVAGNTAAHHGGGILNSSLGSLTIDGSAVIHNSGVIGADLFNGHGIVSINNSILGDRFDV